MAKSKYKKRADGRYYATVTIGKLPNGNPKRKHIYATSTSELDKKITEIKSNKYKGLISTSDTVTFKEWAEKWYEINISTKEYGTQQKIKNVLNNHIYPNIGYFRIKDLKPYHINQIILDMLKKNLTEVTKLTLQTIKRILSDAIQNDIIYKNIAEGIKLPKFNKNEKLPLSNANDNIMYKVSLTHKYGLFFMLMRYCGLRLEETIPLTIKDVNLEKHTLFINKAVTFIQNQPVIKDTKNKKERYIPIPEILIEPLKLHMSNCNDYLFTKQTNQNEMLSKIAVRRMLESFLLAINIEFEKQEKEKNKDFKLTDDMKIKFTCHQLRHSYCTMLYYAGIKIKKAQDLMGHSSADMVYNIYTHLDEKRENADEQINNYVVKMLSK